MKIAPVLLINLLLTCSALFIYDTIKSDSEPMQTHMTTMIDGDGEVTEVDDSAPVELIGNGGQMALTYTQMQRR